MLDRKVKTARAQRIFCRDDTTLERIIHRLEEAQSPIKTLIYRFAKYYTPAVIALAIGACSHRDRDPVADTLDHRLPRGARIGPPVTLVRAIGNAARAGVLMKCDEHLDRAGTFNLVGFDKTGTLTKGDTTVADVKGSIVADGELV